MDSHDSNVTVSESIRAFSERGLINLAPDMSAVPIAYPTYALYSGVSTTYSTVGISLKSEKGMQTVTGIPDLHKPLHA